MRIRRIHHVTLAVRDLEQARATFASLFGAEPDESRDIAAFSARRSDISIGEDTLQLVSPIETDTPLTRFLDRRGEGFYNIALEVDDLDEAVAELTARGVRVSEPIEATPETTPGVRSAFITMSATHGLSVQLMEIVGTSADDASEPPPHVPPRAEDATIESSAAEPAADAPASSPPLLDLTPDEWSDVD